MFCLQNSTVACDKVLPEEGFGLVPLRLVLIRMFSYSIVGAGAPLPQTYDFQQQNGRGNPSPTDIPINFGRDIVFSADL